MKILIDTNVFIWAATIPGRLPEDILVTLKDPESEIFFSAASTWEIAIKYSKGKLELPDHPKYFLEQSLRAAGIISIPITMQDTILVTDLPHHHSDPFDRLLVVQANERKMKLMSGDQMFKKYDVDLIHF